MRLRLLLSVIALLVSCVSTWDAEARDAVSGPILGTGAFFRHCVRADAPALDFDLPPRRFTRQLGLNIDFACLTLRQSELFVETENMLVDGVRVPCRMERHHGLFIRVCRLGQKDMPSW